MFLPLLLAAVAGYLLGSLPFGYLVARAKGVNIFEVGSKNPGATNVRRVLGAGPGNLVFVLDLLKGAIAAGVPLAYFWLHFGSGGPPSAHGPSGMLSSFDGRTGLAVTGLLAALVGHSFSCFTGFRGGKGVATSVGGLVILMPAAAAVAAASWWAVFHFTRYVSLASIVSAGVLVIAAYFLAPPPLLVGLAGLVAGFIVLRHRTNIVRLLNGTESKFVKKNGETKS